MAEFALVNLADDSIRKLVEGDREFADGTPPDVSHKGIEWRPVVEIGKDTPPGADEVKEGPVEAVEPTQVTRTWTIRPMTPTEIADRDAKLDRDAILDGLLDLAEITISLVDELIANTTIAATDFPAATRTKYQSLKARVDRLR